jgi:hypothetical protein
MELNFNLNIPPEFEFINKPFKWYKREYKNILKLQSWNNIIHTSPQFADSYFVQPLIDRSGNTFHWLIKQTFVTSQGVSRFKCKVNREPLYPVELDNGNGPCRIKKLRAKKL